MRNTRAHFSERASNRYVDQREQRQKSFALDLCAKDSSPNKHATTTNTSEILHWPVAAKMTFPLPTTICSIMAEKTGPYFSCEELRLPPRVEPRCLSPPLVQASTQDQLLRNLPFIGRDKSFRGGSQADREKRLLFVLFLEFGHNEHCTKCSLHLSVHTTLAC